SAPRGGTRCATLLPYTPVFRSWGVLVYESEQYGQGNNLFYGISEGRATFQKDKELPSGTYFYILTFTGPNPGKDSYSGYLYINRSEEHTSELQSRENIVCRLPL